MVRSRRMPGIRLERERVLRDGDELPDWWLPEWRAVAVDGRRVTVEGFVVDQEPFVGGGLRDGEMVITDELIVAAAIRFVTENAVLQLPV